MQISLNTHLINILLETDTLFIIKKNKNIKGNTILSKTKLPIETLNLFYLIKEIKQFIRFLSTLCKSKHSYLKISSLKEEILDFSNLFFKKYPLKPSIKLIRYNKKSTLKLKNLTQMLILIEDKITSPSIFRSLFEKKTYLVSKIDDSTQNENSGLYKMYNNLNDFKKLILILVLINQTLNT